MPPLVPRVRVERLEDPLRILWADPDPAVLDGDRGTRLTGSGAQFRLDREAAAGGHGLDGVMYQVEEYLFQLVAVDRYPGQVLLQRHFKPHSAGMDEVRCERQDVLDDLI